MANVGTAAAGKTLIGAGNGVSPTFASIGTNSGLAIHGVVLSQNNSAFTAAGPAAVGTVLMSNGAGVDPSFQSGGTVFGNTITGNSGGARPPTAGNWNLLTANSTVKIAGSGSTLTQDFGITNILLGSAGASIAGGTANNSIGNTALAAIAGGTANNAMGFAALLACSSGSNNVAIGQSCLLQLTTGSNNTCIGQGTGTSYTSSESSNIIIGSGIAGTAAESGVIRIGNSGSATTCFIAGITGVTAAGAPTAVSSTGQLSSLGFGTAGQILISSGANVSPVWTTTLPVANGGTGRATLTNHGVLVGAATSAITQLAVGATGTVLAGSTGADPAFTATPSVTSITLGSGTALANYVEGTWTPTIDGGGSSPTVGYTAQRGQYTRIGNRVILDGLILLSSISGGSGTVQIKGLPLAINGNTQFPTGSIQLSNVTFVANYCTTSAVSGQSYLQITLNTSAGASSDMQISALSSTSLLVFSICYQV